MSSSQPGPRERRPITPAMLVKKTSRSPRGSGSQRWLTLSAPCAISIQAPLSKCRPCMPTEAGRRPVPAPAPVKGSDAPCLGCANACSGLDASPKAAATQSATAVPTTHAREAGGVLTPQQTPIGSRWSVAAWLSLVELLFNELERRQLKRLAVTHVQELIDAVTSYLDRRNEDPVPFVWTASADKIPRKVRRAQRSLAKVKETSGANH